MPKFDVAMKQQKSEADSFMEFARLKDGQFLFDEVAIKEIAQQTMGVSIKYTYTRHGVILRNLDPVQVSSRDFAEARTEAEGNKEKFAKTRLVGRLFSEGSRHYLAQSKQVEEDFLKDMEFIDNMK